MQRRWAKLEKDFKTKQKFFDISKVPDIYDCIKYDLQHNHHTLQFSQAEELYKYSKYLADIIIPQVMIPTTVHFIRFYLQLSFLTGIRDNQTGKTCHRVGHLHSAPSENQSRSTT